jgi:sugar phosphate isomerase/epimerase
VGYDGVVSIEHEDSLLSVSEGLRKAIAFLKEMLIAEPPTQMWWA